MEDDAAGLARPPCQSLPLLPVVLLNGVSDAAGGASGVILPRSIDSLINATQAALLGQPVPVIEPHHAGVRGTGIPNQWEFSGHATILNASAVQITALPRGLSIESFRVRLSQMLDGGLIDGWVDRSIGTTEIVVQLSDALATHWSEDNALDFFGLRQRLSERIVVADWTQLGNGTKPAVKPTTATRTYTSAGQLVHEFAAWRLTRYTNWFEQRQADDRAALRYWRAIKALFAARFPALRSRTINKTIIAQTISQIIGAAQIELDPTQFTRIIDLPADSWTAPFYRAVSAHIAAITQRLAETQAILASPSRLRAQYIADLDTLRQLNQ